MRWKSFLHASAEAKRHVSCPEEESDGASHRAQIAGNGGADSGIAAMDDSNLLAADEIRRRQISLAVRCIAASARTLIFHGLGTTPA
jgi:hypothetical protein